MSFITIIIMLTSRIEYQPTVESFCNCHHPLLLFQGFQPFTAYQHSGFFHILVFHHNRGSHFGFFSGTHNILPQVVLHEFVERYFFFIIFLCLDLPVHDSNLLFLVTYVRQASLIVLLAPGLFLWITSSQPPDLHRNLP